MKRYTISMMVVFVFCFGFVYAQEDVTTTAEISEAAEGLDLQAVSELFKEAENLEKFEEALNNPEMEVNNLDLDENGEVDYIRVIEEVADDVHFIVLQVPLGEDEYQDVATIEIEKSGEEAYEMQVHGNEDLYGEDYYVAPNNVHIHTWPIITWIYRPVYKPYRSVYHFNYYPKWWKPYRPVTVHVYRTRTVRYRSRTTFVYTRHGRVRGVTRVKYTPRSSRRVVTRTRVVRTPGGRKVVKKTTVRKPRR